MSCIILNELPVQQISQRFCAADSDLTIQSSDGVLFLLHQVHLQTSFGSQELCMTIQGETVQLPESSATLDLLFQFCYPERHPDLEGVEFDILADLAEATEKYKLYSAINVCKIRMRDTLPQHALDVLIYASKYDYDDIVDMAAPLVVLKLRLSELLPRLPQTPDQRLRWVLYYETWQNVVQDAISYYDAWVSSYYPTATHPFPLPCMLCGRSANVETDVNRLLRKLGAGLEALIDLDDTFSPCRHAPQGVFLSWRRSVEGNMKRMPAISSLSRPITSTPSKVAPCLPQIPALSIQGVSNRFYATDADVTFQSSDGVHFHIHKKNLEVCAGGFAPPGIEVRGEIVQLTEAAVTLEHLFRFCYPDRHPDVEAMKFDVLALLAEAAEKYEVYSAMNICKIYMKKLVPKLAPHILGYAARHDYPDILDAAAPLVVFQEHLSETLPKLPGHMTMRWVKYFEAVRPSPPCVRGGKKQKIGPVDMPAFSTFK